jgi:hypothetical protein
LPHYAEKKWVLENAEYMHLMPIKEKRRKERELAAEAEEARPRQLMRINLKLSLEHGIKMIPKPNKCEPAVWDALPREGQEKKLHDLPIHLCVSHMWKALFSLENKTPVQKLIVAVNSQSSSDSISETLSKKDLVESLDHNILHIENQRARIERFEKRAMTL